MGSGDGKYPYRLARQCPERLFVAVDANPEGLRSIARQAARKPGKGGVPNLLCLAEAAEALGQALPGVADRVSVILPWGRLLAAVAEPNFDDLRQIAALGQPGAEFELLFSYDRRVDGAGGALSRDGLDAAHVREQLPPRYAEAGLTVQRVEPVAMAELKNYGTTWAKRLAYGRPREVWRIRAVRQKT